MKRSTIGLIFLLSASTAFAQSGEDAGALQTLTAGIADPSSVEAIGALVSPVSVDATSGSATTAIDIQVPSGRAGMTPSVALRYSNHTRTGFIGEGWELNFGYVERSLHDGVPIDNQGDYDDDYGFVLRFEGGSIELDTLVNDDDCTGTCKSYRTHSEEQPITARFYTSNSKNRWEVTDASGTRYIFGKSESARTGISVDKSNKTFRWQLTRSIDLLGNVIDYHYEADATGKEHHYSYPVLVEYGGQDRNPNSAGIEFAHRMFVRLLYVSREVPSVGTTPLDFSRGYASFFDRQLDEARVWVSRPGFAEDSSEAAPRYKYFFGYAASQELIPRLVLETVERVDAQGDPLSPMATLSMDTSQGRPLLSTVDNGLGGSWELGYEHDQSAAVPTATYTVSTLTTRSGQSGTGHTLVSNYAFRDAYKDPVRNRFRGYLEFETTRPGDNHRVVARFEAAPNPGSQPSVYGRLKPVEQSTYDGDTLLSQSTTSWNAKPLSDGRYQLHMLEQESHSFDSLGNSSWTKTTFDSYDANNNVTQSTTEVSDGPGALITVMTYAEREECKKHPRLVTVKDASGFVWTQGKTNYDEKCRAKETLQRLSAHGVSATNGTWVKTSRTTFDPVSGQPSVVYDALNQPTTLSYDELDFYPAHIENALGHVTTAVYDISLGKPVYTMDPNGAETDLVYDAAGRLKHKYRPMDELPWLSYSYDFESLPAIVTVSRREPKALGGSVDAVSFFDGLGRSLQMRAQSYVDGQKKTIVSGSSALDQFGRVTKKHIPYVAGSSIYTYFPAAASKPGEAVTYDAVTGEPTLSTHLDGNQAESVPAFTAGVGITISKDENYLACGGTDGEVEGASCPGEKIITVSDGAGRILSTEVWEGDERAIRKTINTYDVIGQLISTEVTDGTGSGAGHIKTFEYDSFGRQTASVDPNSGRWENRYDIAGRMIASNDPKSGQHLRTCYDVLGRPTLQTVVPHDNFSSGDCTAGEVLADYRYDDVQTLAVGRLSEVSSYDEESGDPIVDKFLSYDARGRVRQTEFRYWLPNQPEETFFFNETYDLSDRLVTRTYPDDGRGYREAVHYDYNALGQLTDVYSAEQNYASGVKYDFMGRMTDVTLGNGVTESFVFGDASQGLRLQQMTSTLPSGSTIQNYSYAAYDAKSQLLTLNDAANGYTAPSLRQDKRFRYDGIGRLERHERVGGAEQGFNYDFLGNLKKGDMLTFGTQAMPFVFKRRSDQPNQIEWVRMGNHPIDDEEENGSELHVSYEGNGGAGNGGLTSCPSLTGNGSLQASYDKLRRVRTLTPPGGETRTQLYNEAGARVMQRGASGTVFYGPYFKKEGADFERYIPFAGKTLAISRLVPEAEGSDELPKYCKVKKNGKLLCRPKLGKAIAKPELFGAGWTHNQSKAANWTSDLEATWRPPSSTMGGDVYISLVMDDRKFNACASGRSVRFGTASRTHTLPLPSNASTKLKFADLGSFILEAGDHFFIEFEGGFSCIETYKAALKLVFLEKSQHSAGNDVVLFRHSDHLNSTTVLTDRAGIVSQFFRYGPFGETKAFDRAGTEIPASLAKTELLYTGQRMDAATGLYDYGARFYDPMLARFLTHDPAEEHVNPYAYVGWNPVMFNDPDGRAAMLAPLIPYVIPAAMAVASYGQALMAAPDTAVDLQDGIDAFESGDYSHFGFAAAATAVPGVTARGLKAMNDVKGFEGYVSKMWKAAGRSYQKFEAAIIERLNKAGVGVATPIKFEAGKAPSPQLSKSEAMKIINEGNVFNDASFGRLRGPAYNRVHPAPTHLLQALWLSENGVDVPQMLENITYEDFADIFELSVDATRGVELDVGGVAQVLESVMGEDAFSF